MLLIGWILFFLGHVAFACVAFNHVHAFAHPVPKGASTKKLTEKVILALTIIPIPILIYALLVKQSEQFPTWLSLYFLFGKMVGGYFILRWIYRTATKHLPTGIELRSSKMLDVQSLVDNPLLVGTKAKLLGCFPGNQVTKLKIQNWDFEFKNLPKDLNGFTICQLSDLHFTGLVKQEYFDQVVLEVNNANPDIVVVTGDILDTDDCLDWIDNVLVKLESKFGIYYVFGNHDLIVTDQVEYRERLAKIGWVAAVDDKCHSIDVGQAKLLLSGNELPWYQATDQTVSVSDAESTDTFSVLLSHSPDQIGWAVARNFDLVFAGHTHGGQIRLPIVGPIIAPSRYGIKYASGTFRIRKTLMHVSRGISGDEPIRLNCPPELGFFRLLNEQP